MNELPDLSALSWQNLGDGPLVRPPFLEPVLADPVVLTPEESPDGRWHLFAHAFFRGICQYVSPDGLSWTRHRMSRVAMALRPFIYREGGEYFLLYERLTALRWPHYDSRIEVRRSKDLVEFGPPQVLLEPSLPWHRTLNQVGNLGNPCLLKVGDRYRLYYSAGVMYLPDCRFDEPRYTAMAEGPSPTGPFTPAQEPQATRDDGSLLDNVYTATRVYASQDTFVGLQTCIFREGEKTRALIRMVRSRDGLAWEAHGPPLVQPDQPWKKSHVYVGDLKRAGDQWRIYYNGRNGWAVGREGLGVVVARAA